MGISSWVTLYTILYSTRTCTYKNEYSYILCAYLFILSLFLLFFFCALSQPLSFSGIIPCVFFFFGLNILPRPDRNHRRAVDYASSIDDYGFWEFLVIVTPTSTLIIYFQLRSPVLISKNSPVREARGEFSDGSSRA